MAGSAWVITRTNAPSGTRSDQIPSEDGRLVGQGRQAKCNVVGVIVWECRGHRVRRL
jgi:hypothetical protein